jgi:capsular exopolysaccharide synthesis family protein
MNQPQHPHSPPNPPQHQPNYHQQGFNQQGFNQQGFPEEEEFSLRDYYESLLRYRFTIIIIVFISFVSSITIHFFLPKKYSSRSLIIKSDGVSNERNPILGALGGGEGGYDLDTLKEITFSENVLNHSMKLIKEEMKKYLEEDITISKEELLMTNERLTHNLIKESSNFSQHQSSKGIFKITTTLNNSPYLSTAITNGITKSLLKSLVDKKKNRFRLQVQTLQSTISNNQDDIKTTESALRSLLNPENGLPIDQNDKKLSHLLENLEQKKRDAELAQKELNDQIISIKKKFNIADTLIENIVWIDTSSSMHLKLKELLFQREELLTRYKKENPSVKKIDNQIASIRETLRPKSDNPNTRYIEVSRFETSNVSRLMALTSQKQAVDNKLNFLHRELAKVSRQILEPPPQQKKARDLKNKLEMINKVHVDLHKSLYNAQMMLLATESEFDIMEYARPNTRSSSLGLVKFSMIGLVLGIALGLATAFLINNFENTLKSSSDLKRHFKYPALGAIPKWDDEDKHVDEMVPDSQIAEVYGILRNNVRFSSISNPEKCLLVASSVQHEGKSLTAINLGLSFALEGNKVLLISADLRRPFSHTRFRRSEDMKKKIGIVDYLDGQAPLEEVIYKSNVENFDFIPTCARANNSAKLLRSPLFKSMLKYGEENYDVVIVDSPAVLPVVDTSLIAPYAKAVLLVAKANQSPINTIQDTINRLEHVGSPIIGISLNMIRDLKLEIFYGQGYSSYSGYNA